MSEVIAKPIEAQEPFANGGENRARGEMLAVFRDYMVTLKRSPATIAATLQPLKPFFAFIDQCGLEMRAVSLKDVEAYRVKLNATGRYTPWSVQAYLRAVERFYDWLEKTGKVLINPMENMSMPGIKALLPRTILTLSEVRKFLNAPDTSSLPGIRDKAILELFYSTGLRLSELCDLTVYDVDVIAGYVRVNSGKGNKDRVVPMGRKASDYLRDYLKNVRGKFTKRRRDERALFVGQKGKKIHNLIVERMVRAYAQAAGIRKRVTPHTLRHTCATHMLQGGANMVHVQRLLGHVQLTTTQVYVRVAGQDVKETHAKTHPRASDEPGKLL